MLLDALVEAFVKSSQHGCSTRYYNGGIHCLPDVNIAALHRIHHHLVHSRPLKADFLWIEEDLSALVLLRAEGDDLSVRQVIHRGVLLLLFFNRHSITVLAHGCHVALQFLNLLHDFELGGRMEYIPCPSEKQLKVLGHISSTKVNSLNRVLNCKTFKHRAAVANSISAIQDHAGSFTPGVQTQDGLLLEKDLGATKLLEKDISCLYSILIGVERGLSQKNRVLLGRNLELIKDVPPYYLHIIPVSNYTVLDWVI